MRAGLLRHRITVQAATSSRNATGEPVAAWAAVGVRWGQILPLSGREATPGSQVEGRNTVRITIRYYPGLTAEHRLTHDGRIFEILSVINPNERGIISDCLCEEVTT